MQPKSKSSHLEMPLVIGAHELNNNLANPLVLSSSHFSITINLHNDKYLKNFIKSQDQDPFICSYNLLNDQTIQVSQQQIANLLNFSDASEIQDSKYLIYNGNTKDSILNDNFKFSFRTKIQSYLDQNKFDIIIEQQNLNFQLLKITSNVKFVKNPLLLNLLESQQNEQKGLLTMDQSSRFLFMQKNMKFPVIGFWLKTQNQLNNIEVYDCFSQFIKEKHYKKCIFSSISSSKNKNKKYFYFIKIASNSNKMETFLVSWTEEPQTKKSYQFERTSKKIEIKWGQQIERTKKSQNPESLSSLIKSVSQQSRVSSKQSSSEKSQQNGMDFTLRESKESKVQSLESLINYSYLSPIKQLEQNKQTQNLFSEDCQNSPQFSTLCKQNQPENQNLELREKVKQQEIEIKKLRQIISIMESELKLYKNSRMSTNCESSTKNNKFSPEMNSPNSMPLTVSQNQNSNGLSPGDIRRLRQSDLRSNSRSDWLKNFSNQKSNQSKNSSFNNSKVANQFKSNPLILQEVNLNLLQQSEKIVCGGSLPKINEEDARDPWEYMEIVQD